MCIFRNHATMFSTCFFLEFFRFVKRISEHANKNDGISLLWIKMKPHFFITDPMDAEKVLNTCLNKSYVYSFFNPWLGNGLLTAKEEIWKRHRRLLTPSFNNTLTNSFLKLFNEKAWKLLELLSDSAGTGALDIRRYLSDIALEAIYESAIGLSENVEKIVEKQYTNASQKLLHISMKRIFTPWLHLDFIYKLTRLKKEEEEALHTVHKIANFVIGIRKKEFQDKYTASSSEMKTGFKPFLQLMLELSATNTAFTDQEIRDEVDTIVAAGYDTSSITLLTVFIVLGSHKKVQDEVYSELRRIFVDSNKDIEKEDLSKMIYLEAVINETLRMYPLGSVIGREIQRDVKLKNCTLPAGSSCYISYWGIHHGPSWGPDFDEFKPERWLIPGSLPSCSAAFGGFSYGRRMCIGKSYAMKLLKTIVARVVLKLQLQADHTKLKHSLDVSLRPTDGHHISFTLR